MMGDNTEIITGDIPEVEGCMPLQSEDVTTISPIMKNKTGKVSTFSVLFYVLIINEYFIILYVYENYV